MNNEMCGCGTEEKTSSAKGIVRINYKEDFELVVELLAGDKPYQLGDEDFRIDFMVMASRYTVGRTAGVCERCAVDGNKIRCFMDSHGLPPGGLHAEVKVNTPDPNYADGSRLSVAIAEGVVLLVKDNTRFDGAVVKANIPVALVDAYHLAKAHGYKGTIDEYYATFTEIGHLKENIKGTLDEMTEAERLRANAETERANAETERQRKQDSLNTAESERVKNEQQRQTNEQARQQAEKDRTTAESNRASAEVERVKTEQQRNRTEEARQTAESQRAKDELARVGSESERTKAEEGRTQAEKQRQTDEELRKQAETKRVNAEEKRMSLEKERSTTFSSMQENINSKIKDVNAATSDLKSIIGMDKGVFASIDALKAAYPSPQVGYSAKVGTELPYTIYVCEKAGVWKDSGAKYTPTTQIPKIEQTIGDSETSVMSQKAITEALNKVDVKTKDGKTLQDVYDMSRSNGLTKVMSYSENDCINAYIRVSGGNVITHDAFRCTELISLLNVTQISASNLSGESDYASVAYYNSHGVFIKSLVSSSVTLLPSDFPASAAFVRFGGRPNKGISISVTISKNAQIDSNTTRVGYLEKSTQVSEEINNLLKGFILTNGKFLANSSFRSTDFLKLSDYEKIIAVGLVSGDSYKGVCVYDSNKVFLSYLTVTGTYEFSASELKNGEIYVRFTLSREKGGVKLVSSISNYVKGNIERLNKFSFRRKSRSGYISSTDGSYIDNPVYRCLMDYVPTLGAQKISCTPSIGGSSFTSFAFYDSDYNFVGIVNNSSMIADVPDNASYFRSTVSKDKDVTCEIIFYNPNPFTILNLISERKILEGKEVAFLGDSITNGYGTTRTYWKFFSDYTGCTSSGYGSNGANIGDRNDSTIQIFEEVKSIKGTENLIVIMAGTNDFGHDMEIGELYSIDAKTGAKSAPNSTASFAGGLHKLILDIFAKAPESNIIFMTPTPRTDKSPTSAEAGGDFTWHRKNNAGLYLQDYADVIKEICAFYGIPVVDLLSNTQMDVTKDIINTKYTFDGLHLNRAGHEIIAKMLYKFIKYNHYSVL